MTECAEDRRLFYAGVGVSVSLLCYGALHSSCRESEAVGTLNVPLQKAFDTIVDVETFYKINALGEGLNKHYSPEITAESYGAVSYTLTHHTWFKTFVTPCERFNIDRNQHSFEESFSSHGLSFSFRWVFKENETDAQKTDVQVKIKAEGMYMMVQLSSKAKRDFEYKLELCNKYWELHK
jgi:hypothetical protein